MAKTKIYEPAGALEVIAGTTYDYTNIPAGCTIVELLYAERLTDLKGEEIGQRGVRVTINNNLAPGANPKSNVPFLWIMGTIIAFNQDYTYRFHNDGIVGYGIEVPL